MISITYPAAAVAITALWILVRAICTAKTRNICLRREAQLLLVYVCLLVVARFTFFPFQTIDGRTQPLVFDAALILPFRINLIPMVHLLDYPELRQILLNIIGNTTMFIPIGVIWPGVFQELNTHEKAFAAGMGFSLCIEILQLPFFDRVTDIDDLILNTLGYLMGYGLYLAVKSVRKKRRAIL